jgi:hypothetical protein
MSKMTIFVVFGGAIILVAVLAAATYVMASAPAMPQTLAAAVPEKASFQADALPAPAIAGRSLRLSEETLRARLDEAYERGTQAQVQALLHILNGRYEHRCCGLPR